MTLYTIGHSTRTTEELVAILAAHGVKRLADVRKLPRSRRHPHFAAEALARSLPPAGVTYRHFPDLGGLRRPLPDSTNNAWQEPGFRGYADYMQTPAFSTALDALVRFAEEDPTCMMCAEALWWHCHRRLISDALVARGLEVRHLGLGGAVESFQIHELTPFARLSGAAVHYPGLV